jgi:VanZ family protein
MATSPALLNPSSLNSSASPFRLISNGWLAVIFAILFVAFTSTTLLSGYHTQFIVNYVWGMVFGQWHYNDAGFVNFAGRKVGHFLGYGTIGLMFRKAWYNSLRTNLLALRGHLTLTSSVLGVVSTFALASLDEWHQMYLPQRHGSMYDALLDTLGATFLTLAIWAVRSIQRRRNQDAVRMLKQYGIRYNAQQSW